MTTTLKASKSRRNAPVKIQAIRPPGLDGRGMYLLPYHPPPMTEAKPGGDDDPVRGRKGFMPARRASTGFNSDLRTTLAVLSAHQAAVGNMTVRGQKGNWKEAQKNELVVFVDAILDALKDPAAQKESGDLYKEALEAKLSGDPKKMLALCELRKESINNYVRARSHFLEMFFDEVVLGQNDSAYVTNETMYAQAVIYGGQDGKPRLQRAIAAQSNWLVPLYFVWSQKYGYQIEDIQRGNVTAPAMKTVDIGFDIAAQMDWNAYLLMTGSLPRGSQNGGLNGIFGSFVTATTNPATKQELLTYWASPRVQQSLLPTTNVLTPWTDPVPAGLTAGRLPGMLVDSANNPVIGFNAAHAVVRYCDQWGGIFMDGPLRPSGLLLVPAIDASSVLSTVTPTAAKPSQIAEGLLSNYTRFEYGNIVWTMMPDNTIPRGTLFAVLNKPVGTNFVKPSFDREFTNTDYEANWEDRWYRKTQGLYVPVQHAPRALAVTYL